MSLLKYLRAKRIRKVWHYTTAGVIWRVHPSDSGLFVGEERDVATKTTRFFCVQQRSGDVLWEHLELPEPWWIGIEDVRREHVFIHGFKSPDLPQHLGVTCLDIFTGEVRWTQTDLEFVSSGDDYLLAARSTVTDREIISVDPATGKLLGPIADQSTLHPATTPSHSSISTPVFPVPVSFSENRNLVAIAEHHCRDRSLVGPAEIVGHDGVVILSYHEQKNVEGDLPIYDNHLVVLDSTSAKVEWDDVITHAAPGIASETFFLVGNIVYFIKERRTLIALLLPE